MSLHYLPEDIIIYIIDFIPDNYSSFSFSTISKRIRNVTKKYGYAKHLSITNNDIFTFINRYTQHYNTLKSIKTIDIEDPQLWIPWTFPKIVHFMNCKISRNISPPKSDTEEIKINDFFRFQNKNSILRINWEKFPKLQKLYIYFNDIDFTGIELCKELKIIFIDLGVNNKIIPETIGIIPNLEQIFTNCILSTKTRFISKNITTCIIKNK